MDLVKNIMKNAAAAEGVSNKHFSVVYSLTLALRRFLVTSGWILTFLFAKTSLLRSSEGSFCRKAVHKPAEGALKLSLLSKYIVFVYSAIFHSLKKKIEPIELN